MKILLTLLAFAVAAWVVVIVAVLAVIDVITKLAPILLVAGLVYLLMRRRQGPRPLPPPSSMVPAVRTPARPLPPVASVPPPQRPVGWAPARPGGWVLLPVWMGPAPVAYSRPTVIDAEVIGEQRRD